MRALDPFVVEKDINDYSVTAVPINGRAPYTVASYIQREDVARLFALAPELRTALDEACGWLEGYALVPGSMLVRDIERFRALLARIDQGGA